MTDTTLADLADRAQRALHKADFDLDMVGAELRRDVPGEELIDVVDHARWTISLLHERLRNIATRLQNKVNAWPEGGWVELTPEQVRAVGLPHGGEAVGRVFQKPDGAIEYEAFSNPLRVTWNWSADDPYHPGVPYLRVVLDD